MSRKTVLYATSKKLQKRFLLLLVFKYTIIRDHIFVSWQLIAFKRCSKVTYLIRSKDVSTWQLILWHETCTLWLPSQIPVSHVNRWCSLLWNYGNWMTLPWHFCLYYIGNWNSFHLFMIIMHTISVVRDVSSSVPNCPAFYRFLSQWLANNSGYWHY